MKYIEALLLITPVDTIYFLVITFSALEPQSFHLYHTKSNLRSSRELEQSSCDPADLPSL